MTKVAAKFAMKDLIDSVDPAYRSVFPADFLAMAEWARGQENVWREEFEKNWADFFRSKKEAGAA